MENQNTEKVIETSEKNNDDVLADIAELKKSLSNIQKSQESLKTLMKENAAVNVQVAASTTPVKSDFEIFKELVDECTNSALDDNIMGYHSFSENGWIAKIGLDWRTDDGESGLQSLYDEWKNTPEFKNYLESKRK